MDLVDVDLFRRIFESMVGCIGMRLMRSRIVNILVFYYIFYVIKSVRWIFSDLEDRREC